MFSLQGPRGALSGRGAAEMADSSLFERWAPLTFLTGACIVAFVRWQKQRGTKADCPDFDTILDRTGYYADKFDPEISKAETSDASQMWIADMDFPVCKRIMAAIQQRAAHPSLGYTFQPTQLWEAVAAWFAQHHDWVVQPSSFVFSVTTSSAASACVRAFSSPGDAVMVLTPLYKPLQSLVECEGRRLVRHSLVQSDGVYDIDFQAFQMEIEREAVRILVFCNPHNPSGRVWKRPELERVLEICRKHDVLVVSDDVHADWCLFGNTYTPLAALADAGEVVTLGGPGKSFGLPGLQSGFVVLEDPALRARYLGAIAHTHTHEGSVFATVGMMAGYSEGAAWLRHAKAYVEKNILLVEEFLKARVPEVRAWRPQATILMWLDFSALHMTAEQLRAMLLKGGLVLSPGVQFGIEGHHFQRMNVACSKIVVQKALKRLERVVGLHRGRLSG